ncbi:hypothetical protein [Desulfotruncus alcoholivorax]|uniref:hypothetical protein n=1 Tax=Desulfotruncus alcoholivorax TaxID=265477 RepID=UPI000407A8DC|nr:hypothetical protein [Desulfotruncus alcoholivorax]
MRHTKILIPALILFLFILPLTVYAAENHSNHGVSNAAGNPGDVMDMSGMNHDNTQMDGMDMDGINMESNTQHSNGGSHNNSDHGSVSGKSSLNQYKNEVVGGFAGLNGMIIAAAALLRRNRQGV